MLRLFFSCLALLVAGAVAIILLVYPPIRATHPAITHGDLPELVPLRAFYANTASSWRYRLSPDGTRIAWLQAKRLRPALWVRNLEDTTAEIYQTADEVRWYQWSSNGQYLLYLADRDGWENDQLVSIDVTKGNSTPRSYDFGRDVRSFLVQVPKDSGSDVLIAHNARDRSKFDLYRLNLDSGETVSLGEVQDRSVWWNFTPQGEIFARTRTLNDGTWVLELKQDTKWREIANGGHGDSLHLLTPPDVADNALALSNLGRDKRVLVRKNLFEGTETVLAAHDEVDLAWVAQHPVSLEPMLAVSFPGKQDRKVLDQKLGDIIDQIDSVQGNSLHFVSSTADFSKSIWEVESDTHGWSKYLLDYENGTAELFSTPPIADFADLLSPTEPIRFDASDGTSIPAYLTRAKGLTGPSPLVILIHGGPIARTWWGFDGMRSWLANRGYHVLDVNYRGSAGYGRAFTAKAEGEISLKVNADIVDARAWAVAEGLADPDKIAVMGGSWGGLQTMMAMTQSPELFAAGVNINGISDLTTLLDESPVYWTDSPDFYRTYIGNQEDPDEMARIRDRSPLYNVDAIKAPVLVIQGANDVRVVRNQADKLVEAMEDIGKDVTYELIPNAGHTFANWGWKTRILTFRKIERFLATHLGGRADGFDYAVFGAQVLPF